MSISSDLQALGIVLQGNASKTLCPKCSHTRKHSKDRCLSVNLQDGLYFCHNCGWAGSVCSTKTPYQTPALKPYTTNEILFSWFTRRGISKQAVERAEIALEGQEIVFPYTRRGIPVNAKYRGLHDKTFRQTKDAEKILYGLDNLTEKWAILCEGEMDVLSLQTVGILPALSVPDGAPAPGANLSDKKFEYLANCAAELEPLTKIVLATDGDAPGQYLAQELARRLGPERCWKVQWPEVETEDGEPYILKDANEVLMALGPEKLKAIIDAATPYPIDGIVTALDLRDEVLALYHEGSQRGLSTGLSSLDEFYTIRPGEMTVVGGIPGHGKSSLVDFILYALSERYGWTTAIFSPENFPLQRHVAKLMSLFCGRPFSTGPSERMTETHVNVSLKWVQSAVVFISPPEDEVTIDTILALAKKTVLRHGIRGLVIDPWNELDHTRPSGMNETEYISKALTKIRRFSRLHGLHVWIVAHPTKMKKNDNGTYPVPTPYDISGSSHWRNKADNCITVYRDLNAEGRDVEVHVQKIRFREVGKIGQVTVQWQPLSGRYQDGYRGP